MIFLLGAPKAVPQICSYLDRYMQTLPCCVIYNIYNQYNHAVLIYVIWQLFFYYDIRTCVQNKNKIMLLATLSLDVLERIICSLEEQKY